MATDTPIPNVGIILTHNRPELLARCVAAASPQFDLLIVIDNASDPPVETDSFPLGENDASLALVHLPDQPPNISTMWTKGLALAAQLAQGFDSDRPERWNVALLCDDVILPDGWVQIVATGLREYGAAAACTHAITPATQPLIKAAPDSDIMNRMTGWAFMLAGEVGLEPDERLEWWWVDTHLDWLARQAGGMVILPGPVAVNERPNEYTVGRPELGQRAGEDGKAFEQIWGWRPW